MHSYVTECSSTVEPNVFISRLKEMNKYRYSTSIDKSLSVRVCRMTLTLLSCLHSDKHMHTYKDWKRVK